MDLGCTGPEGWCTPKHRSTSDPGYHVVGIKRPDAPDISRQIFHAGFRLAIRPGAKE
jgi:hypothetical protein